MQSKFLVRLVRDIKRVKVQRLKDCERIAELLQKTYVP